MHTLKLYIETSVWSHWFADDAPERRESTRDFLSRCQDNPAATRIYISAFVLDEIRGAPSRLATHLETLLDDFRPAMLEPAPEVYELAQTYADLGVIPAGKLADRLHVAIATVAEMDMLVSWNYRHLVNVRRREMVNAANLLAGYLKRLEITTPPEVLEDEVQ